MEEWRDIPGYEGEYQVSDMGQVLGQRGQVLRFGVHRDGYLQVKLCTRGAASTKLVHRLVALVFVPSVEGHLEVDHIDGVKTNNAVSNLRWSTRSKNMRAAADMGLLKYNDNRGSKNGMSRLTEADIPAIRARIATGEFLKHIAVDYGVTREAISSVKHRKNWGSV